MSGVSASCDHSTKRGMLGSTEGPAVNHRASAFTFVLSTGFFILLKICYYIYYLCICMHACMCTYHMCAYVEVRARFAAVRSLWSLCESQHQIQVARLNGKHLFLLSHPVSPKCVLFSIPPSLVLFFIHCVCREVSMWR